MSECPKSEPITEQARSTTDNALIGGGLFLADEVWEFRGIIPYYMSKLHHMEKRTDDISRPVHELVESAYPSPLPRRKLNESAYAVKVGMVVGLGLAESCLVFTDGLRFRRQFVQDVDQLKQVTGDPDNPVLLGDVLAARRQDPLVTGVLNNLPSSLFDPFDATEDPVFAARINDLYADALGYVCAGVAEEMLRYAIISSQPADDGAFEEISASADLIRGTQRISSAAF